MAFKSEYFDYNTHVLRSLYQRHHHGGIKVGKFSDFCAEFTDAIEEDLVFLFKILPKAPALEKAFYKTLGRKEQKIIAGLANLCGVDGKTIPITHFPLAIPDIKVEEDDEYTGIVSTFNKDNEPYYIHSKNALQHFWDNFTVVDMKALSEDDQSYLLDLLDTYEISTLDNERQHLRLVYGLHIPQNLKDFHETCIRELAAEIIAIPELGEVLISFLDKDQSEELGLEYIKSNDDKRKVFNFFVETLARIWGLPKPIEEDYYEPGKKDKSGKKFTSAMHAFYRVLEDKEDNKPAGLIYGSNTFGGYLGGSRRFILEAAAHEFGHLASHFLSYVGEYPNWHKERYDALNTPSVLFSLDNVSERLRTNISFEKFGKYYGATSTDFSDIPAQGLKGHIYAHQLEERHAVWFEDRVGVALNFALSARSNINDFEANKKIASQEFAEVICLAELYNTPLYEDAMARIESCTDFESLQTQCSRLIRGLEFRMAVHENKDSGLYNDAVKAFDNLKECLSFLYDVRDILIDRAIIPESPLRPLLLQNPLNIGENDLIEMHAP